MLLNSFLERFDEIKAEARVRTYVSSQTSQPERAEFLGHFLRTEFQPILEQQDNGFHTIGFEAFMRPVAGTRKVTPLAFFDTLESDERNFVDRLSRELHVTNFMKTALPTDQISLNVSPASLETRGGDLEQMIRQIRGAEAMGLAPDRINIELPVSPNLDPGVIYTLAAHLKNLGPQITLEDFDCDHASISRVMFVRPHVVKFNRSWLNNNLDDPSYRKMISNLIKGIHALGAKAHQERLETQAETRFAVACGFDRLQGFYIGNPAPDLAYPSMDSHIERHGYLVSQGAR